MPWFHRVCVNGVCCVLIWQRVGQDRLALADLQVHRLYHIAVDFDVDEMSVGWGCQKHLHGLPS